MAAMTKILTNSSSQAIPKLVPFKNEPSTYSLSQFSFVLNFLLTISYVMLFTVYFLFSFPYFQLRLQFFFLLENFLIYSNLIFF